MRLRALPFAAILSSAFVPVVARAQALPAAAEAPPATPAAPAASPPSAEPVAPFVTRTAEPEATAVPRTPVENGTVDTAPAPTDAARLRAFKQLYITYDGFTGETFQGTGRRQISSTEFYRTIGRDDLIDTVNARKTKRAVLFMTSGVIGVASLATGAVIFSQTRDLNSEYCSASLDVYNNVCVPEHRATTRGAGIVIVSGLLLSSAILTWGLTTSLEAVTPKETEKLVANYNGQLMRKLRDGSSATATRPGAKIQIIPQLSPQGAGLSTIVTF